MGHIGEDFTTSMLIAQVKRMQAENPELDSLVLKIHSEGGDLTQAEAMVSYLEETGLHLTTIAMGWVASSATYMFLSGHTRLAVEGNLFMFHYPTIKHNAQLSTDNIVILDAEWDKEKNKMVGFYKSRTNLSESELKSILVNDEVISNEDAYTFGITTTQELIPNLVSNKYGVVAMANRQTNIKNATMSLGEIRKSIIARAREKATRTALKKTLNDEKVIEFLRVDEGEEITAGVEVRYEDGSVIEDGTYTFKSGDKVTIEEGKVKEYVKASEESETEAEGEEEKAKELAVEMLNEEKDLLADEIAVAIIEEVEKAVDEAVEEVEKEITALKAEKTAWMAERDGLNSKIEALSKPPATKPRKSASGTQYSEKPKGNLDAILAGAREFRLKDKN